MCGHAVVIGGDGLAGRALVRALEANGWTAAQEPYDLLDARDAAGTVASRRPAAVLLAPDAADPPSGPPPPASATPPRVRAAARGAAAAGARLVLFSSDEVFDGRGGPYTEDAAPGRDDSAIATRESEQAALTAPCDALVVRTSLVFGWSRASDNLAMQVWGRLGAGLRLTVDDTLHTPTLAEYLAEATVRLLELDARGVVHVAGRDTMSRLEFARQVARALLLDGSLIQPATAPLTQPAAAGNGSAGAVGARYGLQTGQLTAMLATEPLSIREMLQRLRREWRSNVTVRPPASQGLPGNALKTEILDRVRAYYHQAHTAQPFVPLTSRVPYSGRVYGEEELVNLVDASLDFWLTLGPWGESFEDRVRRRLGARDVALTNSGSSANLTAVAALCSERLERPLREGDEVITPAATFPTTLAPLLQFRLTPVLVDCEIGTYNVNPDLVAAAVTPRTRAIMIPHTLGNPCDMDAIMEVAGRHDLTVVEDACDALGSRFRGQPVGTFGALATLSFFPAHQITMGEGGAVIVNRPRLSRIVRSVRDWGRDCWCAPGESNSCGKRFGWQLGTLPAGYDHKFIYSDVGFNLKPTDLQAAVGVAQLARLDDFVRSRREHFARLYAALEEHRDHVELPRLDERAEPAWFGFPITLKDGSKRELVQWLQRANIDTRELFAGSIMRQPGYRTARVRVHGELTETERMLHRTFFIGVYPGLSDEMVDFMIDRLHQFFTRTRTAG